MKMIKLKNGYAVASCIQTVLIESRNYVNAPTKYNVAIVLNSGMSAISDFKSEREAKEFMEDIVRQMKEDSDENN